MLLIYTLSPCKILSERLTSNEKEFLFQEDGRVFMLDVTQIFPFFYEAASLTEFSLLIETWLVKVLYLGMLL